MNEQQRDLVFFEIVPTDWLNSFVYYEPEVEAYNVNMDSFGYQSPLVVPNVGTSMWILFFHLALLAIYGLTYKFKGCRRRLGGYLLWNTLVRLLVEVYLEMFMLSALNLRTVDWSNPFNFVKYCNIVSIFIVLTLIIAPLILTYF